MADSHPGLGPADPTKNKSRPQPHSEEFRKSLLWVSNPVALVEMAHDAIVVRDPASVIQYWNPGASDLYGWSAEEAIGSVSHELLETRFLSSQQDVEWSLMNLGHWEGELIHRRKDGSEIRVTSRQALSRDEEGNPVF